MEVLNIGIDLGVSSKHQAEVRDEQGQKVCSSFKFAGTREGFDEVTRHALKGAPEGTKLRFICEPTSMSWFPLAVYAKRNGYEMMRVKAQKSHDLRKYYSKHSKRDKIDAKTLAMMPIVDREGIEDVYLPNEVINALDRRCRQREKIAKQISSIKTRLKFLYHWVMPGLTDCFEDAYGRRARAFYLRYTNLSKVKILGLKRLEKFLSNAGRQKIYSGLPQKVYDAAMVGCELYEDSSEYIDFEELQQEVICELEMLENAEKTQKKVEEAIKRLYDKAHPSKNIESISGISDTLGTVLVGIIGDPERFSSHAKARRYSGLIPKQNESGQRAVKGLNITKEGPSRYRRGLYMASDSGRHWDPQLAKIYYDQMVHKGNCHTQAVCAVSTHLIGRIMAVLKEKRPHVLRDLEGNPISKRAAKKLIEKEFIVPEEIRKRTRGRKKKGYQRNQIRGIAEKQSSRFAKYPS